jgi:hypothetical protein
MSIFSRLLSSANPDTVASFWKQADLLALRPADSAAMEALNRLAHAYHPDTSVSLERNARGTPLLLFHGGATDEGINAALTLNSRPSRSWAFRSNHAHSPAAWRRWSFQASRTFFESPSFTTPNWRAPIAVGRLCLSYLEHAVTCWAAGRDDLGGGWLAAAGIALRACWRHLDTTDAQPSSTFDRVTLALADRVYIALEPPDADSGHAIPFTALRDVVASDSLGVEIDLFSLLWSLLGYVEDVDVSSIVGPVLRWKRDPVTRRERVLCRALLARSPELTEAFAPVLDRWLDPIRATGTDADLYGAPLRHALVLAWCRLNRSRSRSAYLNALAGSSSSHGNAV